LKKEALDRTLYRTRFGRGYRPVVRQTAVGINSNISEMLQVRTCDTRYAAQNNQFRESLFSKIHTLLLGVNDIVPMINVIINFQISSPIYLSFISSNLSYDRSTASSKTIPPLNAI
jgi:hypothetical protein